MQKNSNNPDFFLLAIIAIIVTLGILILASVSAPFSQQKFGSTYYFLLHQLEFGLLPGLILGFAAYKINLSFFKKIAPFLFLFNIFLMILVFFPLIGSRQLGASRWLNLGPISFQPAELLKLTFILYLSSWLSNRITDKKQGEGQKLIIFLIMLGFIGMLLIFQPNVSTLGLIAFIAVLMFFLAKTPWWQSLVVVATGGAGLLLLMKIAPYRANRLAVFLHPGSDPLGKGYQATQSLIAMGSGGLHGVGLGMSSQKFGLLPQLIGDSIFAVFSEETGFIGAFILIFLFLIFLLRGTYIAKSAPDKFSQLAATGIVSWIVMQTFVNIGAMAGIIPLTGIPLPFISYGGSALAIEMIAIGILLNISKNAKT